MREKKRKPKDAIKNEDRRKRSNVLISKEFSDEIRSVFFSPTFNVIALVLLFLSVFGALRVLKARSTKTQIKFVENPRPESSGGEKGKNPKISPPEVFQGEIYDTTIRLRETGALGMAISLAVFGEVSKQGSAPDNLETIWDFIKARNLLPPGLDLSNGELTSESSIFLVRFQKFPLRYEILSSSKDSRKSPAIMMRFPLKSLGGRSITYFQTDTTNPFETPGPFASLEEVVSKGWKIKQWQGELLPRNKELIEVLEKEKQLLKDIRKNN